ncbi:GntR family transcriptional regulator [Lachnoclostridium phytofermentans]|uniref:Transcriptional regulator, GntR family n=1 Tax=Lachnoclostridium phytofermentans (strain ATCC 700394 / DSM 18823 / ISDg) TaxID=357809 RepID=A9KNQ6_LACP7|nr:GntR family transcriptional regulator [Lachnoclostridium phytofermentans]ABX41657.1 transcriptional regulator, GntR family [Lachnoclostridium phytofermentans ISDg]
MEFNNNMPIYMQVIHELKKELIRGNLALGSKMPSARDLAIQYQINPNTANRIYREMELQELCYTKRGLGTFATEDEQRLMRVREEMAKEYMSAFLIGMRDLGLQEEDVISLIKKEFDNTKEQGLS